MAGVLRRECALANVGSRPLVDTDQRRPHAQRPEQTAGGRGPGQHRCLRAPSSTTRSSTSRPRRVDARRIWVGTDDGLVQLTDRRVGDLAQRDAGSRCALGASRCGRSFALRRRARVRRHRPSRDGRSAAVRSGHQRLRRDVARDHQRLAPRSVRARRARGSAQPRRALRRIGAGRVARRSTAARTGRVCG